MTRAKYVELKELAPEIGPGRNKNWKHWSGTWKCGCRKRRVHQTLYAATETRKDYITSYFIKRSFSCVQDPIEPRIEAKRSVTGCWRILQLTTILAMRLIFNWMGNIIINKLSFRIWGALNPYVIQEQCGHPCRVIT